MFTATAVAILALGIGVNAALFGLFNAIVLKTSAVSPVERLVTVTRVDSLTGRAWNSVRTEELAAISDNTQAIFERLVVRDTFTGVLSGVGGSAERVFGESVSGSYFDVFRVSPVLGRLIHPSDGRETGDVVPVVISERLWRQRFASDSAIVGRTVRIAGLPVVVVGVAPETFRGTWMPNLLTADVWVPMRFGPVVGAGTRGAHPSHAVLATMREGIDIAAADSAVAAVGRSLPPWDGPPYRLAVLPGGQGIVPSEFTHSGMAVGAVVLVLSALVFFVACANLANLMLVRGIARSGELATRVALGASRARVVQLLLTEVAILTTLGGTVAMGMVFAVTRLISATSPPTLQGMVLRLDPTPDRAVVAFALVGMAVAAIVVSLAPVRYALRVTPSRATRTGGIAGATREERGDRMRLVAWQIATSVVLLIGTGLYIRSTIEIHQFDPGYDLSSGLTASIDLTTSGIDEVRGHRVWQRMLETAREVPGVADAALASTLPAVSTQRYTTVRVDGVVDGRSRETHPLRYQVSPGFFRALGLQVRAGRDFDDADTAASRRVAIVSARTADELWPGQSPIGRWVTVRDFPESFEIVGMVADTATNILRPTGTPAGAIYLPVSQAYSPTLVLIVRTTEARPALAGPLQQALRGVDPGVAVFDVRTLSETAQLRVMPFRIGMLVFGTLGPLAVAIALLGIYAAMAFLVSQRTGEFGVRKALGATERDIYSLVQRQGLRTICYGLVPGLVVAWLGAGFMKLFVYGIQPRDTVTFVVVPLMLVVAGLLACLAPALRAARVDPVTALRDA